MFADIFGKLPRYRGRCALDNDLDAIGNGRFQLVGRASGSSLIVIFHKLDLLPVPSTRGVNAVDSVARGPAVAAARWRLAGRTAIR